MKALALLTCGGLILASGIVHGMWTDRWMDPQDLEAAVNNFQHFPMELGPWKGEVLDNHTGKASGLAASIEVLYQHAETGKRIKVFLGCGRPGKVSIHTPDVCYAAIGYDMDPQSTESFTCTDGRTGDVYTARFKKNRTGKQNNLRIYWTWYADGNWTVSKNPRLSFHRNKVLHKLYVLHELENLNDAPSPDVCGDLLPRLARALEEEVLALAR